MTQQYLQGCHKLIQKGQYKEAITGFEFVLKLNPQSIEAFRGLTFCYAKLGQWQGALTQAMNTLGHGGNQGPDLAMLINILEASQLLSYIPSVEQVLKYALRFIQLEKRAADQLLVQLKAKYQVLFDAQVPLLDEPFSRVLQDSTFGLLIERNYIADYDIEHVLINGRRLLLEQIAKGESVAAHLPILSAMGCQMLLNDCLYETSNAEQTLLAQFDADSSDLAVILIRLCYSDFNQALQIWQQHKTVIEQANLLGLSHDLDFYQQVISSQNKGEINDETSKKVQDFYMQNPYPKWKSVTTDTINLGQILTRIGKPAMEEPQVLLAGCGTGRQLIEWALTNPKAHITAIDLSPVSVAYAQLMAKKYKLTNVDIKVHDILDVAKLDQTFDFIISTGVLHHMASPQDGLNALASVLRPDGGMYLSFYSKVARVELSEIKQEILAYLSCEEKDLTPSSLRKWRGQLTPQDKQRHWFQIGDFFYLNGLMDLLFHPQQTEYSALELDEMLDQAGLAFKWLPVGQVYQQAYQAAFVQQPIPKSNETLAYWHEFEQKNPKFFAGQFKFFITKK